MKLKNYSSIILVGAISVIAIFVGVWIINKVQVSYEDADKEKNQPVTIKFSYFYSENEASGKAMANIIRDFNASQSNIIVEGSAGASIDKQLVSIMSNNTPDIGYTVWPSALRWAQNGALEPLTSYVEKSPDFNLGDFLPATVNITKYKDETYAIPFYVQTMALYYNKDILNEAGFTKPPETLDELKLMAKAMTQINDKGEIERMGFLPDYPWVDNVLWPILFGAEFYDRKKNEVATTSKEYIRAIDFQNWFYKEWGWDTISSFKLKIGSHEQGPFYTGNLAMVMGGEWVARDIKQFAPNLNFGICSFPYPADRPDLKESSFISPAVIYMPSGSTHKEEAWQFIKYLTSTETMLKFANEYKSLMARKSVITNPQIEIDPELKILADFALSENIKSFPPLPIVDEYLVNLSEQTNLVFKQKKTPTEAMSYVKKVIDPLLKQKK